MSKNMGQRSPLDHQSNHEAHIEPLPPLDKPHKVQMFCITDYFPANLDCYTNNTVFAQPEAAGKEDHS